MKNNNLENLIWIIFATMGAIFLVVGGVVCLDIFDYSNKVDTIGVITDIYTYRGNKDTKHEVHVKYSVNNEEYESLLNSYSSSFYEGKEIRIYYDEDNPNKIGVKSIDYIFLMFPSFGILFLAIGGTGILVRFNKKRLEKYLKQNGKVIYAKYIETILNTGYSVNGRCPYNIICEWNNLEDGKKYIFKSKNLWLNPENIIHEKGIETFPIYIDVKNKKKYVIDVDNITEDVVDLT